VATVVVADDSVGVRELVRAALEPEGHRVLEAGSAAEVFETLEAEPEPPDVILLDVHFGIDDGLLVGADLRKQERYRETKILFMTGTMGRPELERLREELDVEILGKPFDMASLTEAILRE
jgi:CheY-like chemotaxis protein